MESRQSEQKIPDLPSLSDLGSLRGRVAVVTGAAKGIGLACARRLAEAGADVALFDIDGAGVADAAEQIARDFGVRTLGSMVDSSDSVAVRTAIETVTTELAGLHIWVNNAGIFPEIATLDISESDYDRLMTLNQRGMFLASLDAARAMRDHGGGVIINMSSVSGLIAATNSAHYVAAKHAIVGSTKAFARDLAPYGIRVLAVAPTLVRTPGVQAGLDHDEHSRAALEAFVAQIPMGRAAEPDEVARVVYFAATDLAAFMTGSVLTVDGGELVL
ncbi:SDR family NAD(P)-dependent oxidoreductase [Ruania alba]|uniref:NAD(P)-dependent dehydrogenase, short-chain alcohol dehydrogenase family n=1 Tax=Ruania alba TaxID=648782 RepID=A0A1H5EXC6_9MICO|nr:SDR family NAD(P)-dependent oxidoreductase [Ruania alba]SED95765.1 NAD(P)-dependent dehydrogenase, short-chain alcohol dehydrogenase family [Ruania alba]